MIGAVLSLLWSLVAWVFTPVPLTVLAATFGVVYYLASKEYDFWPSLGVPGPRAKFPWGNEFGLPFVSSFVDFEDWIYDKHGGKKFCGYMELHKPALYVGDLDLIRAICIKDFEFFTDRRELVASEVFTEMLFVLNGKEWKRTRAVMSPTFSSSKMKNMHQLCLDNAENLSKYIQGEMKKKGEIDVKDSFGRFTMDNIASCAFGVNCNSFVDPDSEFAKNAAKLFEPPGGYGAFRFMFVLLLGISHPLVRRLPDPQDYINKFFQNAVNRTITHRETSGTSRKDYLQLLLETKDKDGNRVLSDSSIVNQAVLFFIVGYDTTATLLVFAAYCLATEPECQKAVHAEIDSVLEQHGGQLTYEAVMEMTYLDRVISETLRLYPPAIRMERQSSKDYTLPGTDITIPAGTIIQMPILKVHRDPDHYPDPMRFDPDRFLPEEKEKRHPCAYLPFGAGPRNCIAMRFALFEAKVALIALLRRHRLEPTARTPPPPMPLFKKSFLLTPEGGTTFLKAVARE